MTFASDLIAAIAAAETTPYRARVPTLTIYEHADDLFASSEWQMGLLSGVALVADDSLAPDTFVLDTAAT